MENTEVETLIASLQAGMAAPPGNTPKRTELALAYQRAFGSPSGGAVLADLVTNFPIVAPRFMAGDSTEMAAMRDGAAQVVAHILQKMISRPRQEQKKPKQKRVTRKETPNDIQ